MSGILYIVSTPIGNLQDFSLRGITTLKSVELIAAEDTRHSRKLLNHFEITTAMTSVHRHNESEKASELMNYLHQGKSIALISDAGTPLISDPGLTLVRQAIAQGFTVQSIPGPCALITALTLSGLASSHFQFLGFLSAKAKTRLEQIQSIAESTLTTIIYEAPHRLAASLQDMHTVMPQRQVCIASELTKLHEKVARGCPQDILAWLAQEPSHGKGEFVIIISGVSELSVIKDFDHILKNLLAELPLKQAVKLTSQITGVAKNEVYQRALVLKETK